MRTPVKWVPVNFLTLKLKHMTRCVCQVSQQLILIFSIFPAYFKNPFFFCYKQKYMRKFFSKMFSDTIQKFPDYKRKVHSYLRPRQVRSGREEVRAGVGGNICRRHVWGPCRPRESAGSLSRESASSSGQGRGGRGTLACRLAPAARGCKGRS